MIKAIYLSFLLVFLGQSKLLAQEVTLPQKTLKEIKAIKENFMSESKKLRQKIKDKVTEVEGLLISNADEMTLEEKFKEVQKLRSDHQRLRFHTVLQVRKLLPLDQRKYIKLFREQTHPQGVERQGMQRQAGCSGNSNGK